MVVSSAVSVKLKWLADNWSIQVALNNFKAEIYCLYLYSSGLLLIESLRQTEIFYQWFVNDVVL
jgi:hypothetical protein